MMQFKLRFPNFQDSWEKTFLSKLMIFNNGINASKESYGHGRKFINVLDVLNNNYLLYDDIIGSVNVNAKQEETNKVEYGDILFVRSSETRDDVGKCTAYLDRDEYALFGGFVIRGKKVGDYIPFFLKLLLDTSSARNQISSKAGGSTRYNVSQSILNSVELFMPLLPEQQKLADFFTLLDRRIEQQREKVGTWREYKKGMMQKLFNREIQFKDEDGQEFPSWKDMELSRLLNRPANIKEEHPSRKKLLTVKLHLQGIHINETVDSLKIGSTVYYRRSAGQFIYGKQNLFNGAFGIIPDELDGYLSSGDIPTLDFRSEIIEPYYFLYYLSQIKVYRKMESVSIGTGSKRIHEDILLKQRISLPCIKEQQSITEFLEVIDKKVKREDEMLTFLREQKKGFMQQMFV